MKVCVVGSGGREHALARVAGPHAPRWSWRPGNPGMARTRPRPPTRRTRRDGAPHHARAEPPEDIDADLFVIGPEEPLVDGLADQLRADGRLVFGPGADGARLEGSKAFMKEVLAEARRPHGPLRRLRRRRASARAFLRELPGPWVVKTDGLAAGKGVLVTDALDEAEADVAAKLSGASFGDAGRRVVVEEGLVGPECSLLVLCDGTRIACRWRRRRTSSASTTATTGPTPAAWARTRPCPIVDDRLVDRGDRPAPWSRSWRALRRRGIDYRGVLYAGLMLTADGPKVLEYNVRFGDPETQVVLPRLTEDLTGLLAEAAAGRLRTEPRFAPDAAVCVVLAVGGLPGRAAHR